MSNPPTSVSLLLRARSGETDAWDRIADIYGPLVFEQCRRKGLREQEARDVTQEVFLSISQGLNDFRREEQGDSFLCWVRTITTRRIADWFRKNGQAVVGTGGTSAQMALANHAEEPAIDWDPSEWQRRAVRRALDLMQCDFQEHTWQAFWLSEVEGLTTAEICERLEMKPGTVRQAKSKVRKRLNEELGELLDLSPEQQS